MILYGSNFGNANAHTTTNMPTLFAGGGLPQVGDVAQAQRVATGLEARAQHLAQAASGAGAAACPLRRAPAGGCSRGGGDRALGNGRDLERHGEGEKAALIDAADAVKIELIAQDGTATVLKEKTTVQAGEILDCAVMSKKALRAFIAAEIEDAKKQGVLLSVHLKATMMKVSDPIMFGQIVAEFYKDALTKHATVLEQIGFNLNNGIGDLYARIKALPADQQAQIEADIQAVYAARPSLAMVNSDKGITNLHVPSDVIVDASMPAMIRDSGKMWGTDGQLHDTKAVIPDRCYATIYQAVIEDCKQHGAFDPTTMGSVPNVGLMAKKAEEYGSHDKTFQVKADGVVRVTEYAKA